MLSDALENVMDILQSIEKTGIDVYVAHNGKNSSGKFSKDAERHYWSSNTEINGLYIQNFLSLRDVNAIKNELEKSAEFVRFQEGIKVLSDGTLGAAPYVKIAPPKEKSKLSEVLRIGFTVSAQNKRDFEEGVSMMREKRENTRHYHPLNITLPRSGKEFNWSFREP